MNNNSWFIKITLVILFMFTIYSTSLAQEKQKIPVDFFEGKWQGKLRCEIIDRAGGWCTKNGFMGYHIITKDVGTIYFDIKTFHLADDPEVIKQLKESGISVEFYKKLMMAKPAVSDSKTIRGNALLSQFFSKRTHITRNYCEECGGKDGTTTESLPDILVPVSGNINIKENKISIYFRDTPGEYNFDIGEPKFVAPNRIEFNLEYRIEPSGGEYGFEKRAKGELHKVYVRKDALGKTVHINEPIKTDKKTQVEITMPSKDIINIAPNTEVVIKSENLLEIVKGKIHGLIKKLKSKTKFEIHTPTTITSVRGTEYEIYVEDDGTTTVLVFDGEVEFSDKENKKTVIVKKNQKSLVKPDDIPTDPEKIDTEKILNWWE